MTLKITDPTNNGYVDGLQVALEILDRRVKVVQADLDGKSDRVSVSTRLQWHGKLDGLRDAQAEVKRAIAKYTGEESKP
jgi:hypothetical protein